MIGKSIKGMILISLSLLLTGCWDYVGLNEMTIVTGIAIDKDEITNKYLLTYEVVNIAESTKNKAVVTEIVESSGDTVFDAMRNAKKRITNKLYFGNVQIAVISHQIAQKDGILSVTNWFLRDAEIRETINIIISQEETAKKLLEQKCADNPITSYEIKKIVRNDNGVTSSTKDVEVYKIFNILHGNGSALVLPAFHIVKNGNKTINEANGVAVFKKDKMIGYLDPKISKYYLFIDNNVYGGIITLKSKNSDDKNISLEIAENETKKKYTYKDNKIKLYINTKTTVYLGEYENESKPVDEVTIKDIEKKANEIIETGIKKIIQQAKDEFKTDIFCIGTFIHKENSGLWKKIKKNWDDIFMDMEVEVKSDTSIVNTAYLK